MRTFARSTLALAVGALFVCAGPAMAQPSNTATVDQIGDDNMASIEQIKTDNIADIYQEGNRNEGIIDQSTAHSGKGGTFREAFQFVVGNRNWAKIDQAPGNGRAHHVLASQSQFGNNNRALIEQKNSGNTAFQSQVGNRDDAHIVQSGHNNFASQFQAGSTDNEADIRQDTNGHNTNHNVATQFQDGTGNTAWTEQLQPADGGNRAWTEQTGTDNEAKILQGLGSTWTAMSGVLNDASVYQTGTGNSAKIVQN